MALGRRLHVVNLGEDMFPNVVDLGLPSRVFQSVGVSLHGFKMFLDEPYLVADCPDSHSVGECHRANLCSVNGAAMPGLMASAVLIA